MQTVLDCIPCFMRQALHSARLITDDPTVHEQVMRKTLELAATMDLRQCPPAMAQKIHRFIREITGQPDPYRDLKQYHNQFGLALYHKWKPAVLESNDPVESAIKLAIAGNIIDLGVKSQIADAEIEATIENAYSSPLDKHILEQFKKQVNQAQKILYLPDNAGEIAFDRLLIEMLPTEKITLAIKGSPAINDATKDDAQSVGLTRIVNVIDNGSDGPGTLLHDCSATFLEHFNTADLVISKGQGNYESLSDVDKNIFFILKAKCSVIADHLNCQIGEIIFKNSKSMNRSQQKGDNYARI